MTEGSSDSNILKKALACRFPEVEDFLLFVDMKENYPFTGTGNVLRFVQGLAAIRHRRHTLVVLDNDAAGIEVAMRLKDLVLPENIAVFVLPDVIDCNEVETVGPSGPSVENVNGRTYAIEMFLDLRCVSQPKPVVRRTSLNRKLRQ